MDIYLEAVQEILLKLGLGSRAVPKDTKKAKKARNATFFVLDLFIGIFYVESSLGTAVLLMLYSFPILNRVLKINFSFFSDFSRNILILGWKYSI